MSIDFQIDDLVEMINCNDVYGYTKSGSTGKIVSVYEDSLAIIFNHLTGGSYPRNLIAKFIVDKQFVKLQDSNMIRKTKIERKINLMWNRQPYVKRNINHAHI